jgi:alkanesulfonate monooxygenase
VLTVYGTMPELGGSDRAGYPGRLLEQARWLDEAGCRGALLFSDNENIEAWTAAQMIIAGTDRFVPLVAVNPVYMHPFSLAQVVSGIGILYRRGVDLNLVSGGFDLHLRKLGSRLSHEERYDRLTEYGHIVMGLLAGTGPVSRRGAYYTVSSAALPGPLDPGLMPRVFVSGASQDCVRAQRSLAVERLTYPREPGVYEGVRPLAGCGLRLGIIAREDSAVAWRVARRRFPHDPAGEKSHDLAGTLVKSHWHQQQSMDALNGSAPAGAYWLYPFRAYRTFAPYLVGSYDEVGELFARYRELGARTVILDHLPDPEELHHALTALKRSDPAVSAR